MKYLFILTLLIFTNGSLKAQTANNGLDTGVISPMFKGGEKAWSKYLKKNLKYPKEAKKKKNTGDVVVSFMVNIDGSVTDTKIVSSPNEALSKAALDVVKDSPNWIPASELGTLISSEMAIQIRFRLW
jgi:protein TonB